MGVLQDGRTEGVFLRHKIGSKAVSLVLWGGWLTALWMVLAWNPSQSLWAPKPIPSKTVDWRDFFSEFVLPTLPVADSFQAPVRPPQGEGVLVSRGFGVEGHLGEDWNTGEGDKDLGEPVYSPADGWVSMASDFQSMWGKVVLIVYRMPEGSPYPAVEMMFAHLDTMQVKVLDRVKKGQQIGTIGNAEGVYKAHLHWEVRTVVGLGLAGGYSDKLDGWLSPREFLQAQNPGVIPFFRGQDLAQKLWESWGSD